MKTHLLRARPNRPTHQCFAVLAPSCTPLAESVSDRCIRSWAEAEAEQKHYTEAIALLSQLIHRHPQNAIDYNNRGLIYFQNGQLEPAIADYNTAIQLNPLLASAYNNRANYYAAAKQLLAAIVDYDRAIDLNPSHVRALINRGITWRELGMYEQAIEDFDTALLLGQLKEHIYAQRGRTYQLWGDWNFSVADYHRALAELAQPGVSISASRLRLQVETWLYELIDLG